MQDFRLLELYKQKSINFTNKQRSMKKKLLSVMTAMLTMMAGAAMMACNENDEAGISDVLINMVGSNTQDPNITLDNINMLLIREDNGKTDTCLLYNPCCGISDQIYVTGRDNTTYIDYPMKFTATIMNSAHFTGLHLGIENRENWKIEDMAVGTSYSTFHFNPYNKLSSSIWGDTYKPAHGAWSGGIKVVGKRTDADGTAFITISFQNLENCVYDQNWNLHTYFLNGVIEFRIGENGLYPKPEAKKEIDVESMLMPSDELLFFMMDALHGNETQGRRTFFSEAAEEEKLLIINSEEEFRAAYKGNKELPSTGINFDYCSLVIGRTYGEHGGVSLGGFDLADKGDNYHLDVILNNNTNPDYCYCCAFVDLYFWKIYPKMEQKPVVFNRIQQDVNIDPLEVYARMQNRWILEGYSDADGTYHQVGNGRGAERFYIEFKESGRVEGRINDTNDFSGSYILGFVDKRACYEDAVEHGVINLMNWNVTNVADDNPLSQQFMRISNATQFQLVMTYSLALYISPKEYFLFRNN